MWWMSEPASWLYSGRRLGTLWHAATATIWRYAQLATICPPQRSLFSIMKHYLTAVRIGGKTSFTTANLVISWNDHGLWFKVTNPSTSKLQYGIISCLIEMCFSEPLDAHSQLRATRWSHSVLHLALGALYKGSSALAIIVFLLDYSEMNDMYLSVFYRCSTSMCLTSRSLQQRSWSRHRHITPWEAWGLLSQSDCGWSLPTPRAARRVRR